MKRVLETVQTRVPGWRGAVATQLTGGLNNQTWKITKGDKEAVLKTDRSPRQAPFNSRESEARTQSSAAAAGLASKVIYVDELTIFSEFADGVVWERSCLEEKENLEVLADALQRLHALPLTGRSFNAKIAARKYAAAIADPDIDLLNLCMQVISDVPSPQKLCCCHNDLVVENLVSTPELKFLDWEYACDNDPLFDLATVTEHHELSERQVEWLLSAYKGEEGVQWRGRLAEQQALYLALLWLWMASREETTDTELKRVSERVITSCS